MSMALWILSRCRRSGLQREPKGGRRIIDLALFGVVFVAVSDPGRIAYAYLDPGTGSIILQMLLGGVAGAMVVGKLYWYQLTSFFRRNRGHSDTRPESPPE